MRTLHRMAWALAGGTLTGLAFRRNALPALILTSAGGFLLKKATDGLDVQGRAGGWIQDRWDEAEEHLAGDAGDEPAQGRGRSAGRHASPRRLGVEETDAAALRERAGAAPDEEREDGGSGGGGGGEFMARPGERPHHAAG